MQAHFVNVGQGNNMKGEKRIVLLAVFLTIRMQNKMQKMLRNIYIYISLLCKISNYID